MGIPYRLALLGALLATVVICPPASADPVEDGKKAFQLGVNLLTDPDGAKYDEALPHFRKAYELTKNWKVLGNLGLCYLKLERVGEAIETYERYLKDGGKDIDAEERGQIERDLTTFKAQRATVHIVLPAPGLTLQDERVRPNGSRLMNLYPIQGASADLVVYAGRHVFSVLQQETPRWETTLAPGDNASHKFEKSAPAPAASSASAAPPTSGAPPTPPPPASVALEPQLPAEGKLGLPVYIAGGTTAALVLGTAITGFLYLGRRSDYNDINGKADRSRQEAEDARDKASSMQTVSTIFGAAALVGAGVSAYLYFSGGSPSSTTTGKTRISPWASPQGGGFIVGGAL